MAEKYISKYSNNKQVTPAQYVTEIVCEHKAQMEGKDLHHRFWQNNDYWAKYYRNQIATANKLIKKHGDIPVVRALQNRKASRIYSLRSPVLARIIKEEAQKYEKENKTLTKVFNRNKDTKLRKDRQKKNILSKLKEIDDEQE